MTLNQVLNRIKTVCLSHKQVRHFQKSLSTDFLAVHTIKYPAVFLLSNGGIVSTTKHAASVSYRMFILDLVHVSEDHERNEEDVLSDTLSIAMDLVAQMNNSHFDDWHFSGDNSLQELVQYDNDMVAGWVLDISIATLFRQNLCEIPSDLIIIPPDQGGGNTGDMKFVYDEKYIATGAEGKTLTTGGSAAMIPAVNGKRILLITRESSPLYKVSNLPDSAEYTWNNQDIGLGIPTMPGERFLILYRNHD